MAVKLAAPLPDERRDRERHLLYTTIPVQMTLGRSGEWVSCQIDDVSSEGLGVLTQRRLEIGTLVVFATLNGTYRFEVAWCRDAGAREFRLGLRLTEEGVDLKTLFSRIIETRSAS